MKTERNPDGIMAWLRGLAATGQALRAADLKNDRWDTTSVSKALHYLTSTGDLFRAKLAFKQVFYLATEAQAQAYTAEHKARYVAARQAELAARDAATTAARAARADKANAAASAGALRRGKGSGVQIEARPLALDAAAAVADRPLPPVTYCTSHPFVRCPADRPPVLRAGALDYQRHMAKHAAGAA